MEKLGALVFRLLFGDVIEKTIDPNKPENIPRLKAMVEAEKEATRRFWEGPGKVLFDKWQTKIRAGVFQILTNPSETCDCPTCIKARELSMLVKMLADAELTINKE